MSSSSSSVTRKTASSAAKISVVKSAASPVKKTAAKEAKAAAATPVASEPSPKKKTFVGNVLVDEELLNNTPEENIPSVIRFDRSIVTDHLPFWAFEMPKANSLQNTCRIVDIRARRKTSKGVVFRSIPAMQKGFRPRYDKDGNETRKGSFVVSNGPLEPYDLVKDLINKSNKGDGKKEIQGNYYEQREKDPDFQLRKKYHLDPNYPRRKIRFDLDQEDVEIWKAIEARIFELIAESYEYWTPDCHLFRVNRSAKALEYMIKVGEIKSENEITMDEIASCCKAEKNSFSSPILKTYSATDFKTKETVDRHSLETKINVGRYKEIDPCIIKVSPLVKFEKDPSKLVRAVMKEDEVIPYDELPFDKKEQYIATWSITNVGGKGQQWRTNIMTEYLEWFPRPKTSYARKRTIDEDAEEDAVPRVSQGDWKRLKMEAESQDKTEDSAEPREEEESPRDETIKEAADPDSYDANDF